MNLKGKRLLLLGGSSSMIGIVEAARKLGCLVYITDYYDTVRSPAKLIADEYTDISVADYDAIVQYIKDNAIDGVMAAFTDSYLVHYINICERANLPHYGNGESFGIATDKMLFKKACRRCDVSVIPGTNAFSYTEVQDFAKNNEFPLILKPADNSGSRGVIKCESENDLQKCYEYARSFSPTKNVIVERFMSCPSVGIVYQMKGNEPHLAAMCDRDIYNATKNGSAITSGTRYPSAYLERYIKEMDGPVRQMLKSCSFFEGMVSLMAFVDDKSFYMCEMCYRPSGGHHYYLINDQNGIDGLAMLIEYAVTGKNAEYNEKKETPFFHDYCGMIHIIGVPERKIAKISGIENIIKESGVISACQYHHEGDITGRDGTTAQVLASVWFRADNKEQYMEKARHYKSLLNAYDENGKSLVVMQ